jgi:hypothetical protein
MGGADVVALVGEISFANSKHAMSSSVTRPAIRPDRLILLLGTARSGTTWLANILNSHPGCVYSHEPMIKFPNQTLDRILFKAADEGRLTADERNTLLGHWSCAYPSLSRPPFFRKSFLRTPPSVIWMTWLMVHALDRGHGLFRRAFSPSRRTRFDLLVKQGGLSHRVKEQVGALASERLIVIMRHPGAVVASILRGRRLGVMPAEPRGPWIEAHGAIPSGLGYDRAQVEQMKDAEFLTL